MSFVLFSGSAVCVMASVKSERMPVGVYLSEQSYTELNFIYCDNEKGVYFYDTFHSPTSVSAESHDIPVSHNADAYQLF